MLRDRSYILCILYNQDVKYFFEKRFHIEGGGQKSRRGAAGQILYPGEIEMAPHTTPLLSREPSKENIFFAFSFFLNKKGVLFRSAVSLRCPPARPRQFSSFFSSLMPPRHPGCCCCCCCLLQMIIQIGRSFANDHPGASAFCK